MKQKVTAFVLCAALTTAQPLTVFAQDSQQNQEEGLSLVERGMRLLFDGLIQEIEPAMGEMAEALKEIEPMARQLAALIGDVKNYEAPERLENGDIIIRRKLDAPAPPELAPPDATPPTGAPPDGQIDL